MRGKKHMDSCWTVTNRTIPQLRSIQFALKLLIYGSVLAVATLVVWLLGSEAKRIVCGEYRDCLQFADCMGCLEIPVGVLLCLCGEVYAGAW